MSRPNARKLTKRTVDALRAKRKPGLFWDSGLPGFGVRVYASGRVVYVVQSRGPHGSRRVTLGRHGDLTSDEARGRAAVVIDRIKSGEEPLPRAPAAAADPTVEALGRRCLAEHVDRQCKPSTAARYRRLLRAHIVPALGGMSVGAVESADVAELHHALRGTPGTANDVLCSLSRMFSLAETLGWRARGKNPCRAVRAYRSNSRERFLSRAEYRKIGLALREAESAGAMHPPAIAAIRMLLLTGCRSGEIANLQWDDVDRVSGHLRLKDSKTGPRLIPLTGEALAVLDGLKRKSGNPWVFWGFGEGARIGSLHRYWSRLRRKLDLEDVRLHDLRHSFASRALFLGESLPMIGKLLGHSRIETTARYAHLARDSEKASAERVAGSIEAHILPEPGGSPDIAGFSETGAKNRAKVDRENGIGRDIAA